MPNSPFPARLSGSINEALGSDLDVTESARHVYKRWLWLKVEVLTLWGASWTILRSIRFRR
jgi:hypothetical protein